MVKVWQDPSSVYNRIHRVSKEAADDTLAKVQEKLSNRSVHPYATGRLASSYGIEVQSVSSDGVDMVIASDLVYAGAIEYGAWMRGAPGPHISSSGRRKRGGGYTNKGRREVEMAATGGARGRSYWGSRMSKRLREGA